MLINYLQKSEFLAFSGGHLGFGDKYHITAFVNTQRALKCKIRYQNCDCDVKFKKTMFDNTLQGK